jgi:glycerophosphoryl diester phosphodiesterase
MTWLWIPVALGLTLMWLIYSPSYRAKKAVWLRGHFAHRGLYALDQSIPENSTAAFEAAIANGIGIELDVQASADLELYVFHDDDLKRMCGVEGLLEEQSSEALNTLRLRSTDESIPHFAEVLNQVNGQVPLLVEIKTTTRRFETVTAVLNLLKSYEGPYAICSFDPLILLQLKTLDPFILRGLNMEASLGKPHFDLKTRVVLEYALMNFLIRPDYLSIDYTHLNLTYRLHRLWGGFGMMWALPSLDAEQRITRNCETVIFEGYLPPRM